MNDPFSPSYQVARERFLAAAARLEARLEKLTLDARGPLGEELAIDVALVGDPASRSTVVVSSGLHGIEGFFGSAMQLAWMGRLMKDPSALPDQTSAVLVHAINPYGFAWRRRCDEKNVDLNRNYLREDEPYAGAPPGYAELHDLMNPPSPPERLEPFRLKATWKIQRHGMRGLKKTGAEFDTRCFAWDVDLIEWRRIEGRDGLVPVGVFELSRIDGGVHPPPLYFEKILVNQAPKIEMAKRVAKALFTEAYYVVFREDMSELWTYNLSNPWSTGWGRSELSGYEQWIRGLK